MCWAVFKPQNLGTVSAYYPECKGKENARNVCVVTAWAKALLSQSTGSFNLCRALLFQPVFPSSLFKRKTTIGISFTTDLELLFKSVQCHYSCHPRRRQRPRVVKNTWAWLISRADNERQCAWSADLVMLPFCILAKPLQQRWLKV